MQFKKIAILICSMLSINSLFAVRVKNKEYIKALTEFKSCRIKTSILKKYELYQVSNPKSYKDGTNLSERSVEKTDKLTCIFCSHYSVNSKRVWRRHMDLYHQINKGKWCFDSTRRLRSTK